MGKKKLRQRTRLN